MRRYENLRCEDRRCKDAQMSCGCEEIRCEDLRCEDPRHKMLQVQFFDTATVTRENKLTQKHKIFASPHGTAGYPERNLHTATCQTRMPGRHQRKIFAAPIGAATPNAIYTQHAAKPACQEDINAKCSHLLLAQLPRMQFTHSTPPNPHARKTSMQNFRTSYWHSYPKRNLHTARRQTRMPGTHQCKISAAPIGPATLNTIYTQRAAKPACQEHICAKFSQLLLAKLPQTQFTHSTPPNPRASRTSTQNFATPIGTATPNTIYTQHAAKPACQEHINAKFSQLHLAQLPQTQFTHSTPPNPHATNTSTQTFSSSYWHSYPKRNLHTARCQTRMPARHQHKIFAAPIGTATPNIIYTQHAAKPACQEHINAKFTQLLLAQLPQTQFTHSTPPNPHASRTSTQNFRSSYWRSYPEQNLHTASLKNSSGQRTIYTQHAAKPECQEHINAKFSQLPLAQLPQTQFTHSTPPNPHASRTSTQNFRTSYWRSYPKRNLHTARRQTRMPGTHQRKIFAAPIGPATPNAIYTQHAAKGFYIQTLSRTRAHMHNLSHGFTHKRFYAYIHPFTHKRFNAQTLLQTNSLGKC